VSLVLPVAAREEAEQREHKDDDQENPENAHADCTSFRRELSFSPTDEAVKQVRRAVLEDVDLRAPPRFG
jgi:hypothetical protein